MFSEFNNPEFLLGHQVLPSSTVENAAYAIRRALLLYRYVRISAHIGKMWAALRRVDNQLLTLPELGDWANCHSLGIYPAPIARIVGSEGRTCDFDSAFRPIVDHCKDRWVRIATLIILGSYLPAIELIRVGGDYYVRDGNHRVSVFRALGVDYIDAQVTELVP